MTDTSTPSPKVPFYFTETELPYGRDGMRLQTLVTEVLYHEQTPYGRIDIYDTPFYGRMLTLDGIIQTTVTDEFIYHEMMVLLPSTYHQAPKSVLVIGGGDGGAIKTALRIEGVERIVQVEIDTKVIELSKKYLPEISDGAFDDPRVELIIADGAKYLRETDEKFDIIVMDLTDPIPGSPAENLFTEEYYASAKRALNPGGVISVQCGSLVFQPQEVKTMTERLGKNFSTVVLHNAVMPGYQLSSFGFLIATDNDAPTTSEGIERLHRYSTSPLFLSDEVYPTTTVLPPYVLKTLS